MRSTLARVRPETPTIPLPLGFVRYDTIDTLRYDTVDTIRKGRSTGLLAWATEIKVRAERRAGELLAAAVKAEGGRPTEKTGSTVLPVSANPPPTLSDLGVTKTQSSRWQQLAARLDGCQSVGALQSHPRRLQALAWQTV